MTPELTELRHHLLLTLEAIDSMQQKRDVNAKPATYMLHNIPFSKEVFDAWQNGLKAGEAEPEKAKPDFELGSRERDELRRLLACMEELYVRGLPPEKDKPRGVWISNGEKREIYDPKVHDWPPGSVTNNIPIWSWYEEKP